MTDPTLSPNAGQPASLSAEPRADPDGARATPIGYNAREPAPARRSGALQAAVVDAYPRSRPRGGARRSGAWLTVAIAVVILTDGLSFIWRQPEQPQAPITTRLSSPDPLEQAAIAPASLPPASAPHQVAGILGPVAPTPEPSITALIARALEVEAEDPAEASIAYARAAIRGRERAAYYLGQLFETGMGVAENPGMARLWYAAAADLPTAQRRLEELPVVSSSGAPATPVPVFHARLSTGSSEMIWDLPDAASTVRFRVELFGPADEPLPPQETTVPGLLVPFAVGAWRVVGISADGGESAPSIVVRMISAGG